MTILQKNAIADFLEKMPSQSWYDAFSYPIDVAKVKARDYTNAVAGWNVSMGNWAISAGGAGKINGVQPTGTVSNESKGVEFEVAGQLTKNWNIAINASKTKASQTSLGAALTEFVLWQRDIYAGPAGDMRLWSGANGEGTRAYYDARVYAAYLFQAETNGKMSPEMAPWRANLVTNYSFNEGFMKGFNVGLGYRWQQGHILGYALNAARTNLDVNAPYWSDSENATDAWIGYQRKLSDKVNWSIQLNIRNLGQSVGLVPLSVQPDGTPALYRIREGQTWYLTNTFSF
jgi:outer membrane receptor for ferric coprogen and ferric-rhodotorulic acid